MTEERLHEMDVDNFAHAIAEKFLVQPSAHQILQDKNLRENSTVKEIQEALKYALDEYYTIQHPHTNEWLSEVYLLESINEVLDDEIGLDRDDVGEEILDSVISVFKEHDYPVNSISDPGFARWVVAAYADCVD